MFTRYFEENNLIKTYSALKKKKLNTGIDRITKTHYEKIVEQDLSLISKKIKNGTYKPTPYKEVLLIKNKDSKPRLLSIPTIRDKVILEVLKNILSSHYPLEENKLPNLISNISEIIKNNNF